jgi:uncharacterized membrane protein YdjX (TVP38/TMEM64 family)
MLEPTRESSASWRPPRLLIIVLCWVSVIAGVQIYAAAAMLSFTDLLQQIALACHQSPLGPLILITAMALSPLFLLPAALLGGIAGLCFGPVFGVITTLIGCNLSALLTYSLGRLSHQETGRIAQLCTRYGPQLRRHPFLSVIMLRLSFLPYEPVNYLVGLLRLRVGTFLLANTLGSLPGVILIVLLGSTAADLRRGLPFDHSFGLIAAVALMAISIALAVVLRQRAKRGV